MNQTQSLEPPLCMPSAEVCDGVDNDCDETIDEDFDTMTNPTHCGRCDQPCGPANATGRCVGGHRVVGQCNPGFIDLNEISEDGCECAQQNAGVELCNAIDDDCDGRVDENFDRQGDPMNCGQCGTVCALPQAMAGCELGQCVVAACNAGFGDANGAVADGCECEQQNGGDDVCNQVDDDCDGRVDENFDLATDSNLLRRMW